jgi:hypothetical protein
LIHDAGNVGSNTEFFPLEMQVILTVLSETQEPNGYLQSNKAVEQKPTLTLATDAEIKDIHCSRMSLKCGVDAP